MHKVLVVQRRDHRTSLTHELQTICNASNGSEMSLIHTRPASMQEHLYQQHERK